MSLHPQHPLRDLRSLHCCHNFLCLPPLLSFYFFPLIPLFLLCPYTVCTGLTRPDTTPHHTTDATFTVVWREGGIVNVCVDERERETYGKMCQKVVQLFVDQPYWQWQPFGSSRIHFGPNHWHWHWLVCHLVGLSIPIHLFVQHSGLWH